MRIKNGYSTHPRTGSVLHPCYYVLDCDENMQLKKISVFQKDCDRVIYLAKVSLRGSSCEESQAPRYQARSLRQYRAVPVW